MHTDNSTAFNAEMKPAYDALTRAREARGQVRDTAVGALDFAIQQLEGAKTLQDSTTSGGKKTLVSLNRHIARLLTIQLTVKRAPIESRREAKAINQVVFDHLASASLLAPAALTEFSLRTQGIKIATREFCGHMKDLPGTIEKVATGRLTPRRNGLFGFIAAIASRIAGVMRGLLGISKPASKTTLSQLQERTQGIEDIVRRRVALTPRAETVTIETASPPEQVTFGTALRNFRSHVGPSLSTFLRAFIYEHLPADSKNDITSLDPLLEVLADAIDQSPYRTLDGFFDQNALSKATPYKQLKGKRNAEMCKLLINVLQSFFDLMPVDQAIGSVEQARNLKGMRKQFGEEMAKLRALPDDADINAIWGLPDAPIVVVGIADIIEGIQMARDLRHKIARREIREAPADTPTFAKLALEVVPTLRKTLSYERTLKFSLKWFTRWPARYFVGKGAGAVLTRLFGDKLTVRQQQTLRSSLPDVLRILSKLDFSSADSQEARHKFSVMLDVIHQAVTGETPMSTKELTIRLMETVGLFFEHMILSEKTFAIGAKAVAHMPYGFDGKEPVK